MLQFNIPEYGEYIEFLRKQSAFYKHMLRKTPEALQYLQAIRNLTPSTIKYFELGYSPSYTSLQKFLTYNGLEEDKLLTTGSVFQKAAGSDKFYLFEDRVIFPLHDINKNLVSFSGRIWREGAESVKYINSTNTQIYSKSLLLYHLWGIDFSLNYVIVVEGLLDVISLVQAGMRNVIAPCGTALTEEQAFLIKCCVDNVVVLYDSDSAGVKSSKKAVTLSESVGLKAYELQLFGAKDPDEYIKKYGSDNLLSSIQNYLDKYLR